MNEAILLNAEDDRLKLERWAQAGHLYGLIDPFFELPLALERRRLETRDTDPVFYEVIAWDQVTYEPPYLVKVTPEALEWLLHSLSTERWGIFVVADVGLDALANHFQKFVIAKGPDANPYFLRFHDASVLEVLLATWEAREKNIFYGPTQAFGLPDLDTMRVKLLEHPFGPRLKSLPQPEDCLIQLQQSQLNACSDAIDRDLIKVIYWHLRNHHSKCVQFIEKSALEKRIQIAIRKARQYSLGAISDLAGFTALMFELSPNFDEHPSFHRILADPSIPAEVKMRRLSQVITDREWEEAMRLYDRGFWPSVLKTSKK